MCWGSFTPIHVSCIKSSPRSADAKWPYSPFLLQLKGLFSTFCRRNIILLYNEIYSIKWVLLHFLHIDHYFASSTIISPTQKILKPKESIHQANVSYNMFPDIFPNICIYLHIYICIYTDMHTHVCIKYIWRRIGPKRAQLQLTQSYCLELAQNYKVWNVSHTCHIKMNIEKLNGDVSLRREEVFLLVHVNTTIPQ